MYSGVILQSQQWNEFIRIYTTSEPLQASLAKRGALAFQQKQKR